MKNQISPQDVMAGLFTAIATVLINKLWPDPEINQLYKQMPKDIRNIYDNFIKERGSYYEGCRMSERHNP